MIADGRLSLFSRLGGSRWGAWGARHQHVLAIAAVAAVYVVTLANLPLGGIWINDVGSRIIQVQGILQSNYSDYSLKYAGLTVDPGFHYAPITYPFAVVRQDRLFSVYSPLFATMASPFFRVFGYPGLYVIPVVASILMLVGLARIAEELGAGPRAGTYAVLIAALTTPIWFYSMTFWEHTLAVCLCVWGTLHLVRWVRAGRRPNLVWAAVLPALGTFFRPDLYSFSLVFLMIAAWKSRGGCRAGLTAAALFALATVAALVPLWLFQRAAIGAPFGFHVETLFSSTSGLAKHILARPILFFSLFARFSSTLWWSLVLSAPFVALFIANPRLSARTFRYSLPISGLAALAVSFFVYRCFPGSREPIACLGSSNSLFPAAPVLILGLVTYHDSARSPQFEAARRLIWLVALTYAVVYGLAAPEMSKWGIHWGSRYLLVLYPLLAVLTAVNISDWQKLASGPGRWKTVVVAALVVVSLGAQILSLGILQRKMAYSLRLNQEAARRPEQVIITDRWWLGQELYSQFYQKLIFLATSADQYRDLARNLVERGVTRVIFAGPPVPGEAPQPGTIRVDDGGLGYWTLDLVPTDLGRPGR